MTSRVDLEALEAALNELPEAELIVDAGGTDLIANSVQGEWVGRLRVKAYARALALLRNSAPALTAEVRALRAAADDPRTVNHWYQVAHQATAERDRLAVEVERLEDCTVDAEQHRQMREERDALREQKARLREALEMCQTTMEDADYGEDCDLRDRIEEVGRILASTADATGGEG